MAPGTPSLAWAIAAAGIVLSQPTIVTIAANEARLHALRPHRNAVGDGDRVQLHRRAARFPDAVFHLLGQVAVVEVTGHGLDPGVGHTHYGFAEVLLRVAHALEEGSGRCPVAPFEDGAAPVP